MVILEDSRMETKGLLQRTVQERTQVVYFVDGVMLHTPNFSTYLFLYLGVAGKLIKHPLND